MGYSSINAQGLSAPPYFTAYLFTNITTYITDRTQQRGLVLMITSLVGGIGYIILAAVTTVGVRYFAVYLAAAGVFSTRPKSLAWTLNMLTKPLSALVRSLSLQGWDVSADSRTIRQPRKRYRPRRWTCAYQRHRTVWTDSRYKTLPHSVRSTVRQGNEYLCRFHVFRCSNGLRVTNSFSVGK